MKKSEFDKIKVMILYIVFAVLFYSFVVPSSKLRYFAISSSLLTFGAVQFLFILFGKVKLPFPISKLGFAVPIIAVSLYLLILSMFVFQSLYVDNFSRDSEIGASRLDMQFLHAAQYINSNFQPNTKIGSGHIGTLNYFSTASIVDYGGKVDYKAVQAARENKTYEFLVNNSVKYVVEFVSTTNMDIIDKNDIVFSEPVISNRLFTGYVLILNLNQKYV